MLLSLERANAKALLFTRLIATLPKSFYFFFNRISRYVQSKESKNLSSKTPQITCKAIFRSCLNNNYSLSVWAYAIHPCKHLFPKKIDRSADIAPTPVA